MSFYSDKYTGFIELRRRDKGDTCHMGETKWHFSCGKEFGLWSLNVHAHLFVFCVIGPFKRKSTVAA